MPLDRHSPLLPTGWELKNSIRDAFPDNSVIAARTLREAKQRSRLYLIFMTPRSGSTWLTELMASAGGLGVPQEWFNESFLRSNEPALGCRPPLLRGTLDINDYLRSIVDEGRGVAGAEISIFQALMLAELFEGAPEEGILDASFYLRRWDVIAQGISLYRSAKSGRFHSYQTKPEEIRSFQEVKYDADEIAHWIRQSLNMRIFSRSYSKKPGCGQFRSFTRTFSRIRWATCVKLPKESVSSDPTSFQPRISR